MVNRLVDLFSQDIIHTGFTGKISATEVYNAGTWARQFGEKLSITIFAKLVHTISYDTVSDIETVQAELVLNLQPMGLSFPLQPAAPGQEVLSCTIWNNYFY